MSPQRDDIREQLSAYLDGELSQAQLGRVQDAIRGDPQLAAELEALRAVRKLLRGLPRASAPHGFTERVVGRAERAGALEVSAAPVRRPAAWWLGRLAAAAVILVAVGVGVLVVARLAAPVGPGPTGEHVAMVEARDRGALPKDVELAAAPTAAPKEHTEAYPGKGGAPAGAVTANQPFVEPPAAQFFINTDNLVLANEEVQRVLDSNGIVPVEGPPPRAMPARVMVSRPNFYEQTVVRANRIELDVVLDETEVRKIVSELNAIRSRQNVAQVPMREVTFLAGPVNGQARAGEAESAHKRLAEAEKDRAPGDGKETTLGQVLPERQADLSQMKPKTGEGQIASKVGRRPVLEAQTQQEPAVSVAEGKWDDFWNARSALADAKAGQALAQAPSTRPAAAKAAAQQLAYPRTQVLNYQSRQIARMIADQTTNQVAAASQQAIPVGANLRRLRITLLQPAEAGRAATAPASEN
jgi:hypothetical protein